MPIGLGVIILLLLVAIGGGVAAATKRPERPQAPPLPPPSPEPPPFQPAPVEPERLPPSVSIITTTPPAKPKASARDAKLRKLKAMVDALGPEPAIGKIMEAKILAGELGMKATDDALTDRLKVAVARVQEQERLKAGQP